MNEKLEEIIESIAQQANEMQDFLSTTAKSKRSGKANETAAQVFLQQHQSFLSDAVGKLREVAATEAKNDGLPHASTPYRPIRNATVIQTTITSPLRASSECEIRNRNLYDFISNISPVISVRGAAINQSFLENNKSDLSVGDLSTWFHQRTQLSDTSECDVSIKLSSNPAAKDPIDSTIDSEMHNFKELLAKIREIMEGSHLKRFQRPKTILII